MSAAPIEVSSASLAYRLSRSGAASIKEVAVRALRRQLQFEHLWAVRDVSFTVERGAILAVIGANGAGKTTLLKLLARVLPPTEGRVVVRGMVAPLIALGAGFNSELTGRENILLYGSILGHEPRRMKAGAAAIAEWADLTDFLDVPLRSYSSGMLARLGFAIATAVDPSILLVDEVLSVGDEVFRRRSAERISRMIEAGTAVVLVTHDLDTVERMAHEAIWLDHGSVVLRGRPADVVAAYRARAEESTAMLETVGA
jgi:ABC-2 type transport system ATP-binding protein